ncbi:MAG: hypothetical protein IT383_14120 [Deltaproteobacteria bacterium]|nr:hypothetical protein [Deltaproteobacteria bacterium]
MLLLVGAGACSTDQPKAPAVVDAGAARPVAIDAGAADAGTPVAATAHDAGPSDAGALPATAAPLTASADPTPAAPERPVAAPAKGTVFDRVLAKPKERGADPAQIKALIEQRTKLKVELTRRTAGTWVLIQLAAVPGGRTERDQREAIRALEGLGIFAVVEGDRLVKVKTP